MKTTILAAVALAATLTACNHGTPKAALDTDLDTLSYAMGMSQSEGLKPYLAERMGVDTAYIDAFIKGLNEGASAGDDKKKAAYYAGIQIGQQISTQMVKGINYELFAGDSTQTISVRNLLAGFVAGTTGKKQLMTPAEAQATTQRLMSAIKAQAAEKQWGAYKKTNAAYVAKYQKGDGVQALPCGVLYKVLKPGTGACPTDTSTVVVNYEGKTIDGKVFDSSYQRKQPAEFQVGQVIKGWSEALKAMPVGAKWEVVIPQALAYGERQQGDAIKPFSTLVFTIELLSIK